MRPAASGSRILLGVAGMSQQAPRLHLPNRAELLVATSRYIDEFKHVDACLAESRTAATGQQRLEALIEM